jgi:hypothetical protein
MRYLKRGGYRLSFSSQSVLQSGVCGRTIKPVTVKWDSRGEQAILLVPLRLAGDIRYWVSCDPSASVLRFIEDATVDLTY